jgi:ABC-type multidrug transport system fused ATPase/permease subunit
LIDGLTRGQDLKATTAIPMLVIWVLAVRYIVRLVDNLAYYGLNQSYLDYLFRYKLQNEINWRFFKKVSSLDVAYFEDPQAQNLLTKTSDTMAWRPPDFLRRSSFLFTNVVAYVVAFLALLTFEWWIPVLVTVVTVPRLYLRTKYGALQWSIWGSGAPQVRKLWYFSWLLRDETAVREMRVFQSQKALMRRFKKLQDYLLGLNKKALDKYLRVLLLPPLMETLVLMGIAYWFLPTVWAGVVTVGSFTLLLSMVGQLNGRAARVASNLGQLYEDNLYIEHLFDVLRLPKMVEEVRKPVSFEKIEPPRIEFRNVSFSYPGSETVVLNNISYSIDPGENVALVGPNGAGKTTMVKLLCRFYDVTSGEILVNGVNIKKLKLTNWYKFLGTLFQDFVQYRFSVRENISLGSPGKKDEAALKWAAEKSGAAKFIETLPKGYDQILGREYEEGEQLSTGQWQKLAIARAFYEAAPVLILDEPTSAIDAEAEYEIFNNLNRYYKDKSLLLVSHRFSTVRNADKILVIEKGEITERGSHRQLLVKKGKYARMFKVQARGYR